MSGDCYFLVQYRKTLRNPESNEDKFCSVEHEGLYVLSDGASESYNSELWAQILVDSVCVDASLKRVTRWLRRAIAEYELKCDVANLTWSQEAAFSRGSFASLLVLKLGDEMAHITSIGDTIALAVEDRSIVRSFPYENSYEFAQRPQLLSTLLERNFNSYFRLSLRSILSRSFKGIKGCTLRFPYPTKSRSFFVCVTDALGEWLLRKDERAQERLDLILNVRSQTEFEHLVMKERECDGMRKDDSTLILIGRE